MQSVKIQGSKKDMVKLEERFEEGPWFPLFLKELKGLMGKADSCPDAEVVSKKKKTFAVKANLSVNKSVNKSYASHTYVH